MREFKLSRSDQAALQAFLVDLVRIPSPSGQEGQLAERIILEMQRLGLCNVGKDRIGNCYGWVGDSSHPVLMLNAHMDTVAVSQLATWHHSPFGAEIEHGRLYGVGACDMKGGLAAMVYGAKLLRDSGLNLQGSLVLACVVLEEPCEGLGTRMLIEEEGIRPDWVVLGEPTSLDVTRGHRGRLELQVCVHGRSAHAAYPQLGENAIYGASRLVFGLEMLASQAANDSFLGQGTLAVTNIVSKAASPHAIPDCCELLVDRRLTLGETELKALTEIQRVIAREGVQAEVVVRECEGYSYTGYPYHVRLSYPAWVIAEDHPLVVTAVEALRKQLKRRPRVTAYGFSTEGVYTAGNAGIPTIGFGPGDPHLAHTTDEYVKLSDVFAAAEGYARLAWELLKPNGAEQQGVTR